MSEPVLEALRRAAVYRVLAGAFAYPARDHLDEVARTAATAAAVDPSPPVAQALRALAQAADDSDAGVLAETHVALFERGTACPPYEGAYGVPQMSGKATQLADIAGFYAAFEMTPVPAQRDVDDHIGAELDFMAALALKEGWAAAEQEGEGFEIVRSAERAFVDDHLARWAEAFAARVLEVEPPAFYAAAARLLVAWLHDDCGRLCVVPRPLGGPQPAEDGSPFACPMAAAEDQQEDGGRSGR
jgi:putative dimethyl sulfoxide reductase chaperone